MQRLSAASEVEKKEMLDLAKEIDVEMVRARDLAAMCLTAGHCTVGFRRVCAALTQPLALARV